MDSPGPVHLHSEEAQGQPAVSFLGGVSPLRAVPHMGEMGWRESWNPKIRHSPGLLTGAQNLPELVFGTRKAQQRRGQVSTSGMPGALCVSPGAWLSVQPCPCPLQPAQCTQLHSGGPVPGSGSLTLLPPPCAFCEHMASSSCL